MPENKIGGIRRSNCIGTFGPGAIVEFRTTNGAAISVVVNGLEHWNEYASPPGLSNPQVTYERRLQKFLNVSGFRLPPVDPNEKGKVFLTATRFPIWLQCPKCERLRKAEMWDNGGPGEPARYCSKCSSSNQRIFVVPVRFVLTCKKGHLQEFPWDFWVQHAEDCSKPSLILSQSGKAGLAGLILKCTKCKRSRSMEGAFGKETMKGLIKCYGLRPWLGKGTDEGCLETPRAVQRGASNLYFPVIASALAIPPFTDSIQTKLDPYWQDFMKEPKNEWPQVIKYQHLEDKLGITKDEILNEVIRAMTALGETGITQIRYEEYEKLCSSASLNEQVDFDIRHERIPSSLEKYFDRIVRVVRLREVRAIKGFTRLQPPSGELEQDSTTLAKISKTTLNWLPAIEVRGEGIFISFRESSLEKWESGKGKDELMKRAREINRVYSEAWYERYGKESIPPRKITPRFLLVHSFAHAIIRQLSLSSGYSSSSLRERLYIDENLGMAGLLIYTSTSDSDGSLGGLERQGKPDRMRTLVPAAIEAIKWCSNDPLCIKDISTFSNSQNRASCHACMMLSETSCEEFNVLLDRGMLIGLPDYKEIGFFSSLLNPISEI